ncbi:alpha/beta-hydrolase [Myriangium duriaei CBS 260.36]|uniref:Alpha/beta-hydrolase n=1 Tax=Myriangium duriaei CBS 260.36 TaxID=1168546 RepID=A0A9P4IR82_9PEZI|nr:alpha/beta-hydrolase [Myriangium duriaei CBS 260.36]
MDPFQLQVESGKQVSGFVHIPSNPTPSSTKARPLVILFHGGTYTAKYWDAHPDHSIVAISDALNIPVVAINAPGTLDTTPPDMLGEDKRWYYEQANLLNHHFLPAIWDKYGKPNSASSVVIWGHSMGAQRAYVTAGHYFECAAETPRYPLAGLLIHGIAPSLYPFGEDSDLMKMSKLAATQPGGIWPQDAKDKLFLMPHYGLADPAKFSNVQGVNIASIREEQLGSFDLMKWGRDIARYVEVPVMHFLGTHDCFYPPTDENMQATRDWFPNAKTFRSVKLINAPHGAEWGPLSTAYYIQGLGFAVECAVLKDMGNVRDYVPTESIFD